MSLADLIKNQQARSPCRVYILKVIYQVCELIALLAIFRPYA